VYALYRKERDGTETLVTYVDDQVEIGCVIDEDRKKLDYEPVYRVEKEN
jgi:hypothetical protein